MARKEKAEFSRQDIGSLAFGRGGSRMFGQRYNNVRIGEIEIYGYRTKKEVSMSNTATQELE